MKHFLIAICFMFPMLATAQQNYQIKSIHGEVSLRHVNEKTWKKAKALTYVNLEDILNVNKGGGVTLLEKSTGRVFVSTETGKVSVQDRLVNAEKKAQSLYSSLNSELMKSAKQQKGGHPYVSIAAVTRGNCDTCPAQMDLYDSVYTSILNFFKDEKNAELSDIIVEKTFVPECAFSITIKNNSDKLLYFNAVHIMDGRPAICYDIDDIDFIPLQPRASVHLTSFPLFQDQGQYILIASEINLSIELLEATFESEPILTSCELECIKFKRL